MLISVFRFLFCLVLSTYVVVLIVGRIYVVEEKLLKCEKHNREEGNKRFNGS